MDDIKTWAPVFAAGAAAIAALIALANVVITNRNARRTRAIDIIGKKEAEFDSERMVKHRVHAAKALLAKSTSDASIDAVLNFMESVARYVTKGDVPAEEVWFTFYYWFNSYYVATRAIISTEQTKDKSCWEDLSQVYALINKLQKEKGRPVAIGEPAIKHFLEEEAALRDDENSSSKIAI